MPNTITPKAIKAEVVVDERINSKGVDYQILLIYIVLKNGTKVLVHEVYITEPIKQTLNALSNY